MAAQKSVKSYKLLVHSAEQVVLIVSDGRGCLAGQEMNAIEVLEAKPGLGGISIVVGCDGCIVEVDHDSKIASRYEDANFQQTISAEGMSVIPGLIDSHTHPVWAGDRVHEFVKKLAGASYMDIHAAGGGIHFTVEQTRKASEKQLLNSLKERLQRMLLAGTTTVECKSGYGLEWPSERKMLAVINAAERETCLDVSVTYCGAHAIPKDKTPEEATESIISDSLPRLSREIQDGSLRVDSVDVFCECGVFNLPQSRRILEAGAKIGLAANFHGDELHAIGAAEMGALIGARAISHLEEISSEGIKQMAAAGSVAVILPTTAYMLRLKPPPVRRLIDSGVVVALGTDFNPNAFCLSMPLVMHLACVLLGMTMNEALAAATINAAKALGLQNTHGSLQAGKQADMLLVKAARWEHLVYQMGCHVDVIGMVIKKGEVVVDTVRMESYK